VRFHAVAASGVFETSTLGHALSAAMHKCGQWSMFDCCRTRLSHIPASHVWPFQEWLETDRACYLIRQYVFSNLYHRLSMRPFMSHIEKVPRSAPTSAVYLRSLACA